MKLTIVQKALIISAYVAGYESGHNDTVENNYSDSLGSAQDWLNDSLEDDSLEDSFVEIITELESGK